MSTLVEDAIKRLDRNSHCPHRWGDLDARDKEQLLCSEIYHLGSQDLLSDKRAKWFIRFGEYSAQELGFVSKESASLWIQSLGREVEWRAGFIFRLLGVATDIAIVDKNGAIAKP